MPERHSTPARSFWTACSTNGSHGSPACAVKTPPPWSSTPAVRMRTTVPGKPSSAITTLLPPARTRIGSFCASASSTAATTSSSLRASIIRAAGPPRRSVVSSESRLMRRLACRAVRLLAFSDIHRDLDQARRIASMAADADVLVAAGDFGSMHRGVEQLIDMLVVVETPTVLVPGNNETDDELRDACGGWKASTVMHGSGTEIDGVSFWGLGAGIPTTPWPWSFDLSEDEAEAALQSCPADVDVLVLHSPPHGYLDGDRSLGSQALLRAIERVQPGVAVCGHIHECAGHETTVGPTRLYNLGPAGIWIDV